MVWDKKKYCNAWKSFPMKRSMLRVRIFLHRREFVRKRPVAGCRLPNSEKFSSTETNLTHAIYKYNFCGYMEIIFCVDYIWYEKKNNLSKFLYCKLLVKMKKKHFWESIGILPIYMYIHSYFCKQPSGARIISLKCWRQFSISQTRA